MTLQEAATELGNTLRSKGVDCYVGIAETYNRIHVYLVTKKDKHRLPQSYKGFAVNTVVSGKMIMGNLIG